MGIARPSSSPKAPGGVIRSPGPHRVGDAGGSGSRAAKEPPHFMLQPQQESLAAARVIQEVSEVPGSTAQTMHLVPNQVLKQLTAKSASPQASHGHRKTQGTCLAVVYGLLPTHGRRDTGQVIGTTRARGTGGSRKLETALAGQVWQTGTNQGCSNWSHLRCKACQPDCREAKCAV